VISSVEPSSAAPAGYLVPGYIDLQVNGHEDIDVATAGDREWARLDGLLAGQGVTAWCPTLVTAPLDSYPPALGRIADAAGRPGPLPAILGAHLEGPFLGTRPGAHRPDLVREPDLDWIADLPAIVRIMTLGAEPEGASQAIAALCRRGVTVSIGHSGANLDQARAAADAGARLVTHLFNAMGPMHHRDPGLAVAALTDARLVPTVISDGIHVHPAMVRLAFAARAGLGAIGPALVTDAIGWRAGTIGGAAVARDGQGAPRRADGTIAGSALSMDRAVANAVDFGVSPAQALAGATAVPAAVLQDRTRGVLEPGARGDLLLLGPDLDLLATWIGGQEVWRAG
jgi:N-acetylglucosamine-6-phosphate deacetylase